MGNYATKQKLWLDGKFDELLPKLDLSSDLECVLKALVLFARGDVIALVEFCEPIMEEQQGRTNSTTAVCLPLLMALMNFITRGGLQGRSVPDIDAQLESAASAVGQVLTKDERLVLASLSECCMHFVEGVRDSDLLRLHDCVEQTTRLLSGADGARCAAANSFVPVLRILRGIAAMKQYAIRRRAADAFASFRDAQAAARHCPDNLVLRDLWIEPVQAIVREEELLELLPRAPDRLAALLTPEPPVRFDTLTEVFVGQRQLLTQLRRLFEQRTKGLMETDCALVLWFSGASGQGKTYLAQLIAEALHGAPDAQEAGRLVVINCQNLRTADSVNSLVDPPTGIQGRGPLISGLEACSNAVVVLDELDKAAAEAIENTLLPAFERNGYLKSPKDGRVVRTGQAVFVITSNIGAAKIDQQTAEYVAAEEPRRQALVAEWQAHVKQELAKQYNRPFLNRATSNFFLFVPLTDAEREQAVSMELRRWAHRLHRRTGLVVLWSRGVVEHFACNFEQFHGHAVDRACADAANECIGPGQTDEDGLAASAGCYYLYLQLDPKGQPALRMEPIRTALAYGCHDPGRVVDCLRSKLPTLWDAQPAGLSDPERVEALLRAIADGATVPASAASPRPQPAAEAEQMQTTVRARRPSGDTGHRPAAGGVGTVSSPRRAVERDPDVERLTGRLAELVGESERLQELLTSRDAELVSARQQLAESEKEREALTATVSEQARELEKLRQLVRSLQKTLLGVLTSAALVLWVISWFVPSYVLVLPLLVLAALAVAFWALLLPVLSACCDAVLAILGPQATAACGLGVLVLFFVRSVVGHVPLGCR